MKKYAMVLVFILCLPVSVFSQEIVSADEVIQKIIDDEEIFYSNVTVEGIVDFSKINRKEIEKDIEFVYCTFTDVVKAEYITFANLYFRDCVFKDNLAILSTEIDSIDFNKSVFEGEFSLNNSKIEFSVDFTDSTFKSMSYFENAYFIRGYIYFNKVTFYNNVTFLNAILNGDTKFIKTIFKREANFDSCSFGDNYNNSIHFIEVDFLDSVSFKYCNFLGNTVFSDSSFNKAFFIYSVFEEKAIFRNNRFNNADFTGTDFIGETDFTNNTLNGEPYNPTLKYF